MSDLLSDAEGDEYPPKHGWTCFHCGEVFLSAGGARDHFGAEPTAKPGCFIKVDLGGERGLLMALRDAEAEIARHMHEDTDLHRSLYQMQSKHSDALRDAEDAGYARGLKDNIRAQREGVSEWISVDDELPKDDTRVDCKYDSVYALRENILFWIDGKRNHFGGFAEIDGKGSQPATHWRIATRATN